MSDSAIMRSPSTRTFSPFSLKYGRSFVTEYGSMRNGASFPAIGPAARHIDRLWIELQFHRLSIDRRKEAIREISYNGGRESLRIAFLISYCITPVVMWRRRIDEAI